MAIAMKIGAGQSQQLRWHLPRLLRHSYSYVCERHYDHIDVVYNQASAWYSAVIAPFIAWAKIYFPPIASLSPVLVQGGITTTLTRKQLFIDTDIQFANELRTDHVEA